MGRLIYVLLGTWTKALPFRPFASAEARGLVADVLGSWGLGHAASMAQQCASELVTDALQHGSPPIHLVIKRWSDAVQVTVIDWNGRRDDGHGASRVFEEGWMRRRIVDGLVTRQGVEPLAKGRAAWFDIALARATS